MNENNNTLINCEKWKFGQFEMPSLWNNEDEIYNLMQSFKRPRYIDPEAYDFKINFWSNLILKYAHHHHVLVVNEVQMQSIFSKELQSNGLNIKPLCLSTVILNMISERKLIEIFNFDGGSIIGKVVTGLGWAVSAPLNWSFNKISQVFYSKGTTEGESEKRCGDVVIVDVVSRCLTECLQWMTSHEDLYITPKLSIMTLADFDKLLLAYFPHQISRNFAKQLLVKRRLIEIVTLPKATLTKGDSDSKASETVQVVKLAKNEHTPLEHSGLDKEDADRINGLILLRAVQTGLVNDEQLLEQRIANLKEKVKVSLRAGRKEEAKTHLIRCKQTEKLLERKLKQLQNIENMLLEIDVSSDNLQVIKALSNAAGVLKSRSMDIDTVQDIMAEVGDALADQEEINASVSAIGGQNDFDELEDEFSRLVSIDNAVNTDEFPHLPDVPQHKIPHPDVIRTPLQNPNY